VIIRHEEKFIGDDGIFLAESKLMTVPHSMTGVTEIQKKLDSPNFQIVGFRREQFEGESLARLEYTRLAENGEAYTGWVDFDPAHNWVVRRWSRTQTKNPTDSSDLINTAMNIDYRLIDPTHYLPRRIEQTFHALKPNLRQRRLVEYDEIIVGPPDESLFRLSGYGLPDVPLRPLTAAAGPSLLGNAWFWASLVVGALSLSALVFSRSRRASASAGN
jgi:hypothetical protein